MSGSSSRSRSSVNLQSSLHSFRISDAFEQETTTKQPFYKATSASMSFANQSQYSGAASIASSTVSAGSAGSEVLDTVIAVYSYPADKPHSLSLQRGDIIQVYSKLASGWWDGINSHGQRGWFPSNYTQPINHAPVPAQPPQQQFHQAKDSLINRNFNFASSSSESVDPLTSSSSLGLTPNLNNGVEILTLDLDNDEDEDEEPTVHDRRTHHHQASNATTLSSHMIVPQLQTSTSSFHDAKGGEDSRKNSVASYTSDEAPPPGFIDSYKLVDTKRDSYQHSPSHWIPQIANGQLAYANTQRNHASTGLPFEPVDDPNSDTEAIPKTVKAPNEFIESAYNEANPPVYEPYMNREHRSSRSSIDSRYSLASTNTFSLQGVESHSWSGMLAHLKQAVEALNEVYCKFDEPGLAAKYNDVAATVQTMNLMAGIPPGTLPSSTTHPDTTILYRRVMTLVSKIGLICDMSSIRRSSDPRRPSVTSSIGETMERAASLVTEEQFVEMTAALVADCDKFIENFKRVYISESTESISDEDHIEQPASVFPVRQLRSGSWVDIAVSGNGQLTNAPAPSNASGLGILPQKRSLFNLEAYESNVPIDATTVAYLEDKQNVVINAIDHVYRIMAPLDKSQSSIQAVQDRKKTLSAYLTGLMNKLNILLNLIESLDLSIYYGGRKRSMFYRSARVGPSRDAFNCLRLLYEFLDAKQRIHDEAVEIATAMKQSDGASSADFIATLSLQMEQARLVDLVTTYESSIEQSIKDKLGVLSENLTKLTEAATSLAAERLNLANFGSRPIKLDPAAMAAASAQAQRMGVNASLSSSVDYDSLSDLKSPTSTRHYSATGTDVTSASSSVKDDTVWYLQLEHGDEMVYDRKGEPRGGTMRALVEQLTNHSKLRPEFNNAMLLTFRSFSDAHELFDLLVERYAIQPPEGLTPEEFQIWKDKKQAPIRLRVINILKTWLEVYWLEDDGDDIFSHMSSAASYVSGQSSLSNTSASSRTALLESMQKFVTQIKAQKKYSVTALLNIIEKRMKNKEPSFKRRMTINTTPFPPPILPKSLKKFKLTDLDPMELARQLTLREFALYRIITPQECLNRGCSSRRKSGVTRASSDTQRIGEFIRNSNNMTNWVSHSILTHNDVKKRAAVIKYFVQVADACRAINNFSSMTAIISGLYSSTIHRMKKTWDAVPSKSQALLESMNKLMNSTRNFNEYRDMLSLVTPPAVPFFGVYLTDLTFTEDGNPDYLQGNTNIINFAKRAKAASVIESIRTFQRMPYNYEEVPEIQEFLKYGFEMAPPIEEQYDTSLFMEPREKPGTDHVAKALVDTGIL